jgi:hypothetical protein
VGRVNRLTERRVLRRAAQQALTLPALEQISDPPPSHRRTDADYIPPRDWDAHDSVPAPPQEDQWDTAGASAPPAPVPGGDYREQPWDYVWDDRPGQPAHFPTPATASTIDSADAGVQQALSAGYDEADAPSGWLASGGDDLWDVHPTAATGRQHNQDLPPIGGPAPVYFQPLPQRIWTADYRPRPWYRTRRAAAAFAGTAAAIIAVGILVVTHTPSKASEDSTGVAPQATTSPAAPHTTAPTPMSSPAPPPPPPPPAPPPPPPPPAAAPPQVAPAPTWRGSTPRQTTQADQPPQTNVTGPQISFAPKPVTPPVTAGPGQHSGGFHW